MYPFLSALFTITYLLYVQDNQLINPEPAKHLQYFELESTMPAAAILANGANTVKFDHELKIKICDITAVDALAQQILQFKEQAAKITTIEIDTSTYFQALEEQEDSAKQVSEDTVCQSLNTILDAIASLNGDLKTFSWLAPEHTGSHFTRPHSFWRALYAHSSTLQNLYLAFFCHEVQFLPAPPSGTTFDALKDLRLDTSSAHGDDGTAIDTLLKSCPNLSTLHLEWPPCDLESCQIKNLSWDWDFPQLEHLHTHGWNFAPASYTDFLVRHPHLTSIGERVDGPYESEEYGPVPVRLPTTALRKLKVLEKAYTDTHSLQDYFDPAAGRPIDTLVLHVRDYEGVEQELLDIAVLPTAQSGLCTLEIRSGISCWRRHEKEDSSEDSDDNETPEEHDQRRQRTNQTTQDREKKRLPSILEATLPHLPHLETLIIQMDSSNCTYNPSTKTFTCPEPMNKRDLYATLALLPKKRQGKLTILRLKDSRAAADPRAGRIREWVGEMNHGMGRDEAVQGSLRVLEWCGKESSVVGLW